MRTNKALPWIDQLPLTPHERRAIKKSAKDPAVDFRVSLRSGEETLWHLDDLLDRVTDAHYGVSTERYRRFNRRFWPPWIYVALGATGVGAGGVGLLADLPTNASVGLVTAGVVTTVWAGAQLKRMRAFGQRAPEAGAQILADLQELRETAHRYAQNPVGRIRKIYTTKGVPPPGLIEDRSLHVRISAVVRLDLVEAIKADPGIELERFQRESGIPPRRARVTAEQIVDSIENNLPWWLPLTRKQPVRRVTLDLVLTQRPNSHPALTTIVRVSAP